MKRDQVVAEGGAGAPETQGEPRALCDTPIETIARQTYLTPAEASIYLRFDTADAFRKFANRHGIPRAHRGRRVLYLRRDLDRLVTGQARTTDLISERTQSVSRHRGASL